MNILKSGKSIVMLDTRFDTLGAISFVVNVYRAAGLSCRSMLSERPRHLALPGYPVLERIEGRLQEFLVCRDHRLISICTMGAAHFEALAGADAIQYEQHVPGHFVFKVVSRKPLEETSLRKIEEAVAEKTQDGCTVEVQQVEHITMTRSGKHMMLQQHLDLSGHLGKRESE